MTEGFFSKDPEKVVNEIKERLYGRLNRSRQLLATFDSDLANLSRGELGYRTGVNEEIMYLEKLLDDLERS
jgi:hypothetical protein